MQPAPVRCRSHKQGDRSRCFSINLKRNYWRCFSESCNANNGGKKGGDVINFVALMEGCREKDAAEKLLRLVQRGEERNPSAHGRGVETATEIKRSIQTLALPADSVKYMQGD